MNEFEIIATDIETAIQTSNYRIKEFWYWDFINDSTSIIYAMYISWILWAEEARQWRGFSKIIKELEDDSKLDISMRKYDLNDFKKFISPVPKSNIIDILKSLWWIRIALSHWNLDINKINKAINKSYALNTISHIPWVEINNNKLEINQSIFHLSKRVIIYLQKNF